MSDRAEGQPYRRVRGYPWNVDYLTRDEAAAVLEEAKVSGFGDVIGGLRGGFTYWAGFHETTGPIVRSTVMPADAQDDRAGTPRG